MVDHTIMMNFIEIVLCRFESCFSRKAAFRWFVTITVGLMLRSDKLGVTSVIRDLALSPDCYDSMIHFFRSSAWSLENIRERWFSIVKESLQHRGEPGAGNLPLSQLSEIGERVDEPG